MIKGYRDPSGVYSSIKPYLNHLNILVIYLVTHPLLTSINVINKLKLNLFILHKSYW